MGRPQVSVRDRESRGHRRWDSPGGRRGQLFSRDGWGDRLAVPLKMCKRGGEKAGPLEEQDYNVGTPLLLPQPDPDPVRKLGTSGKCTVVGGQTDRQTEGRRELYHTESITKKQLIFQGNSFFFFFLSVSFKKITIILPLPRQLTGLYSTPRQGRWWWWWWGGGRREGREGGRVEDFINKRQVPDPQFVNIS